MEFEWDEAKDAANRVKHGVGFEAVARCDWSDYKAFVDNRWSYGESREVAYLRLDDRLHVCVFVLRDHRFRIISFRKANRREERRYGR